MPKFSVQKNHTLWRSAISAARGFVSAVVSEKKIRWVVLSLIGTTALCFFADVGYFQILMVIFSWVLALICEMFNTALEKALDYSSGMQYHPMIRDGKDYAAACTFIAVIFATSLSLFVLWERTHNYPIDRMEFRTSYKEIPKNPAP